VSIQRQARFLDVIERYFGLEAADADALLTRMRTVDVRGGDWLFHQGDPADALYFVVRGRLQAWLSDASGAARGRLLGEILPGESIGEIGLLTGNARSAGIRSIRDSQLLELGATDFQRFATEHPELMLRLAGSIAARLSQRTSRAHDPQRRWTTIALVPLARYAWLDSFCRSLADELRSHRRILALGKDALAGLGAPDAAVGDDDDVSDALRHWLDALEDDHELVLYAADPGNTRWTRLCLRQADLTVFIADASDPPSIRDWEHALLAKSGHAISKRALVLRHASREAGIAGAGDWLADRCPDFHVHLRGDSAPDLARLGRLLAGQATGLVLGAGAARGFAEIGVFRALEEARVPIDWVGGSSIGGIIGAAIALDRGAAYVTEASREAFVRGKPFSDYTLPLLSVIRGRRMERLIGQHLGGNIEDLPLPFFCVSTALDTGELMIHEHGSIATALRATASMPGLLPPAVVERRLAIDGAVTNNLPVDVMRSKPVGHVIAVTVTAPGRERTVDYPALPSPWSMLRRRLLPVGPRISAPGVVATMIKAAEIGSLARMRRLGEQADLLLEPPVDRFSLTNVDAFDALVETGYEYACRRLESWQHPAGDG
jgi:predicted acylesterase/phospholipase RssA/CRP-like cAMP-binding protein